MKRIKMKPLVVGSLLFSLFLGCGEQAGPRTQLDEFLNALRAKDYRMAYDLCSFKDRYTKSAEEFSEAFKKYDDGLRSNGLEGFAFSFNIDSAATVKDTFRAYVRITSLDVEGAPYAGLYRSVSSEPITDSVKDAGGAYVYAVTYHGTICLVKEHEGWGVYADWERQRLRDAEESRIRVEYIKTGLKIGRKKMDVYPDAGKAYLYAVLTNKGEKTVLDAEVMVVCLDKDGKPCDILTVHPVKRRGPALLPGKSVKFKVDLSSAPGEWAKAVDMKVVNCRLGE